MSSKLRISKKQAVAIGEYLDLVIFCTAVSVMNLTNKSEADAVLIAGKFAQAKMPEMVMSYQESLDAGFVGANFAEEALRENNI